MNISKKINFAIVGCGMIANAHASSLLDIYNANLIGAWDLDDSKAQDFCKKYSISKYNSFEEILNDEKIDAVCICTPSYCHYEQTKKALTSGKNVVVEKPMALFASEAKNLCDLAKDNNKQLSVISQTRFANDVIYLKKLIESNKFGKLSFCDQYMKYYRDASYYSDSLWRGKIKYDGGGALMNQGIHGVDLLHYLLGEAHLIAGKTKTTLHDIETEDCATAILEYSCGAIGVIEASTAVYPGFRRRIEINGEKGYAVLCDTTLEKLYLNGKMIISKELEPHPKTAQSPAIATNDLHKLQIKNFIAAICGEEKLISSAYDGYYAVNLIESIYNSSKNI